MRIFWFGKIAVFLDPKWIECCMALWSIEAINIQTVTMLPLVAIDMQWLLICTYCFLCVAFEHAAHLLVRLLNENNSRHQLGISFLKVGLLLLNRHVAYCCSFTMTPSQRQLCYIFFCKNLWALSHYNCYRHVLEQYDRCTPVCLYVCDSDMPPILILLPSISIQPSIVPSTHLSTVHPSVILHNPVGLTAWESWVSWYHTYDDRKEAPDYSKQLPDITVYRTAWEWIYSRTRHFPI